MSKTEYERIIDLSLEIRDKDRENVVLYVVIVFLVIISIYYAVQDKSIKGNAEALCQSQRYSTGVAKTIDRKTGILSLSCTPINSYKNNTRVNTGE